MPTGVPDFVPVLREFGIPLGILAGLVFVLWRRILVLGSEVERDDKEHEKAVSLLQKEIDYRESLRLEERAGRIEAEKRLDNAVSAMSDQTDVLRSIQIEQIRGGKWSGET